MEESSAVSNKGFFCRIGKFQNANLDSLVALVKPQTSQILKVSGELDEWANFKKEKKKKSCGFISAGLILFIRERKNKKKRV